MKPSINLQDVFLNQVRKDRSQVVIYLTNGFQIKGYIRGFDSFIIILEDEDKQMMIYKHSIATISPSVPVTFTGGQNTENK
ncbi:MAG: RNA chaperone Hfq [Clostridiaceae bacterium]|nr:RNA chaperone Hfq [Clostridiaceae bacterium]